MEESGGSSLVEKGGDKILRGTWCQRRQQKGCIKGGNRGGDGGFKEVSGGAMSLTWGVDQVGEGGERGSRKGEG